MINQPTAQELLQAVAQFLRETAAPRLAGQAAFHARVAANALDIVARELRDGARADARRLADLRSLLGRDDLAPAPHGPVREGNPGVDVEELARELCRRIARDEFTPDTPGLVDHLWRSALDAIAIDQPGYASGDSGAQPAGRDGAAAARPSSGGDAVPRNKDPQ